LQKDFEIFGCEAANQFLGKPAVLQDATRQGDAPREARLAILHGLQAIATMARASPL